MLAFAAYCAGVSATLCRKCRHSIHDIRFRYPIVAAVYPHSRAVLYRFFCPCYPAHQSHSLWMCTRGCCNAFAALRSCRRNAFAVVFFGRSASGSAPVVYESQRVTTSLKVHRDPALRCTVSSVTQICAGQSNKAHCLHDHAGRQSFPRSIWDDGEDGKLWRACPS